MAKKYIVEKEFNHNGLKCVVTFSNMGHRCGYVGVPKWHPLYGKDYMDYLDINKEDIEGKEVSGVFPLLGALIDEDESYNNEVLEHTEKWNQLKADKGISASKICVNPTFQIVPEKQT